VVCVIALDLILGGGWGSGQLTPEPDLDARAEQLKLSDR